MPESSSPSRDDSTSSGDEILLAQFRAGNPAALGRLLERYELPLFQFLLGILRDRHQAEDALQETWCKALEHLDDVDCAHLRGWLFTVAYHQAMLYKRRQKLRTPDSHGTHERFVDPAPSPEAQAEQRDAVERVQKLMERLPVAQREVIRQRLFEGKRFHEIAAALGCPLNTALARMHEGLKRLRHLWRNEHV